MVAFSEPMTRAGILKTHARQAYHAEQGAAIFSKAKPRLAIYSHVVKKELLGDAGDQVVIKRTRAAGYDGPLIMGQDRMIVEVGDEVRVLPPPSIDGIADFDKPDSRF